MWACVNRRMYVQGYLTSLNNTKSAISYKQRSFPRSLLCLSFVVHQSNLQPLDLYLAVDAV